MKRHTRFPDSTFQEPIYHLALGFFDGLHLGHKSVIINPTNLDHLQHTAVASFWPHPQHVLSKKSPILLTSIDDKSVILKQWGIGHLVIIPFSKELANQAPQEFLDTLNQAFPHLKSLSVGPNFRFGQHRSGTLTDIQQWCALQHIQFVHNEFVIHAEEPISSSRIRTCLIQGDLHSARIMLGYCYTITGQVVSGDKIGTRLNFPTANISVDRELPLKHGVYFGYAMIGNQQHRITTAINYGIRPTLDSTQESALQLEAHLIGWDGNLYGKTVSLELHRFLRAEQAFDSLDSLKAQIKEDVDQCIQLAAAL